MTAEQDRRIDEAFAREQRRLRNFIRKRVADERDADDILQDVFYELVEASRLLKPVEFVTAWLFRIAQNRITDLFRRKRPEVPAGDLGDVFLSSSAGPEEAYTQRVLLEELVAGLEELPSEQREVFIAHELEGQSFNDLAAATGVKVNTLISRKHYAVVHLRKRLRTLYEELES
jgi:RNA polymerase sigma factor (sigma-70 family)